MFVDARFCKTHTPWQCEHCLWLLALPLQQCEHAQPSVSAHPALEHRGLRSTLALLLGVAMRCLPPRTPNKLQPNTLNGLASLGMFVFFCIETIYWQASDVPLQYSRGPPPIARLSLFSQCCSHLLRGRCKICEAYLQRYDCELPVPVSCDVCDGAESGCRQTEDTQHS